MYEAFYGFRDKPFSLVPDPRFIHLGRQHRAALTMLEYGLESQAGFTVITGDIGCGKTSLIRHLLARATHDLSVGVLTNTHPSLSGLTRWILLAFGLDRPGLDDVAQYRWLVEHLVAEHERGRRSVLIVDEAQNMTPEMLEELRVLSNVNADGLLVLQLILVGQPQLVDTLTSPGLEQLCQRITVSHHLEPLAADETGDYIRHRLRVAGGDPETFLPDTHPLVHAHSEGVPRLINLLCDTALVYGYGAGRERIDRALVEEVVRDRASRRLNAFAGTASGPGPASGRGSGPAEAD